MIHNKAGSSHLVTGAYQLPNAASIELNNNNPEDTKPGILEQYLKLCHLHFR